MAFINNGCCEHANLLEPITFEPGKLELHLPIIKGLVEDMEAGNVTFKGEKVHSLIHLSKLYYKHLNDQGE